jgi:hypothetical protein
VNPHCSALCNDSSLAYDASSGTYTRIGESTELALRVFVEKVGLTVSLFVCFGVVGGGEGRLGAAQAPACVCVCVCVWCGVVCAQGRA